MNLVPIIVKRKHDARGAKPDMALEMAMTHDTELAMQVALRVTHDTCEHDTDDDAQNALSDDVSGLNEAAALESDTCDLTDDASELDEAAALEMAMQVARESMAQVDVLRSEKAAHENTSRCQSEQIDSLSAKLLEAEEQLQAERRWKAEKKEQVRKTVDELRLMMVKLLDPHPPHM